jgi:hypothetical protein
VCVESDCPHGVKCILACALVKASQG